MFYRLRPVNSLTQIFDTCREGGLFKEEDLGSQFIVNGSCSFGFLSEFCKLSPLKRSCFSLFWQGNKGSQYIPAASHASGSH